MAKVLSTCTPSEQLWSYVNQRDLAVIPDIYSYLDGCNAQQIQELMNVWPLKAKDATCAEVEGQLLLSTSYIIHLMAVKIFENIALTMIGNQALLDKFGNQFERLCHFKHLLLIPNKFYLPINAMVRTVHLQAHALHDKLTPDILQKIYEIALSKIKPMFQIDTINLTIPDLGAIPFPEPLPRFYSPFWEVLCKTLIQDKTDSHIVGLAFPPFRISSAQIVCLQKSLEGKTVDEIDLLVDKYDFDEGIMQTLQHISIANKVKKWSIQGLPAQYQKSMLDFCNLRNISLDSKP